MHVGHGKCWVFESRWRKRQEGRREACFEQGGAHEKGGDFLALPPFFFLYNCLVTFACVVYEKEKERRQDGDHGGVEESEGCREAIDDEGWSCHNSHCCRLSLVPIQGMEASVPTSSCLPRCSPS